MSDRSAIEWTESTWNPVRGCTKVSPGCKNCYAEKFAERWRGVAGHPYEHGFDVRLVPEALDLPLRWRKPRRVFVNSMSDLFHEAVPDTFIADVFNTMKQAPRHTFQVLTKRAARMSAFVRRWTGATLPLPNVWLGVSVEDRRSRARIAELERTPAVVRFLSCEPLLEDLGDLELAGTGIRWVIVGGESGPRARPCAEEWVRSIVGQCRAAGAAVFVKQLGAYVVSEQRTAPAELMANPERLGPEDRAPNGEVWAWRAGLRHPKGSDPAEWPADLRVRQMPEVTR